MRSFMAALTICGVLSCDDESVKTRAEVIGSLEEQSLPARSEVSLGLPDQVGDMSELVVSFRRPDVKTSLFVTVMAEADHVWPHQHQGGTTFFVDYEPNSSNVKVGVTQPYGLGAPLDILPSDTTIDMHLFVDKNVTEVFWMGGRTVVKTETPATTAAGMSVGAIDEGVTLVSAKAWRVDCFWDRSVVV